MRKFNKLLFDIATFNKIGDIGCIGGSYLGFNNLDDSNKKLPMLVPRNISWYYVDPKAPIQEFDKYGIQHIYISYGLLKCDEFGNVLPKSKQFLSKIYKRDKNGCKIRDKDGKPIEIEARGRSLEEECGTLVLYTTNEYYRRKYMGETNIDKCKKYEIYEHYENSGIRNNEVMEEEAKIQERNLRLEFEKSTEDQWHYNPWLPRPKFATDKIWDILKHHDSYYGWKDGFSELQLLDAIKEENIDPRYYELYLSSKSNTFAQAMSNSTRNGYDN